MTTKMRLCSLAWLGTALLALDVVRFAGRCAGDRGRYARLSCKNVAGAAGGRRSCLFCCRPLYPALRVATWNGVDCGWRRNRAPRALADRASDPVFRHLSVRLGWPRAGGRYQSVPVRSRRPRTGIPARSSCLPADQPRRLRTDDLPAPRGGRVRSGRQGLGQRQGHAPGHARLRGRRHRLPAAVAAPRRAAGRAGPHLRLEPACPVVLRQ